MGDERAEPAVAEPRSWLWATWILRSLTGLMFLVTVGLIWWATEPSGGATPAPSKSRGSVVTAGSPRQAVDSAAEQSSRSSVAPSTTSTTTTTTPPITTTTTPPPPSTVPPTTAPAPAPAVTAGGSEVEEVAAELITAVDMQSAGRYDIPATADNVALLVRWMSNEGGLWANNPLNTSLGAANFPHQYTLAGADTGIPIFPTMHAGVVATATTLLDNHAYAGILKTLNPGTASCLAFAHAVIKSPWAASHYGHDPAGFCSASPSSAEGGGRRGRGHFKTVRLGGHHKR